MAERGSVVGRNDGALSFPQEFIAYGESLLTNGLCVRDGISGIGLVTRGFIYGMTDVYIGTDSSGITTSWSNSEGVLTTTWTDSEASITTSWTPVVNGIWGEYLP